MNRFGIALVAAAMVSGFLPEAARAEVPPDQIIPRQKQALLADKEISAILSGITDNDHLACPAITAADVQVTPTSGDKKRGAFRVLVACQGAFGNVDKDVTFSGTVLWIGGDIDIAAVTLTTIQISQR